MMDLMMGLPHVCQNSKGLGISKEDMQENIWPWANPKSGEERENGSMSSSVSNHRW